MTDQFVDANKMMPITPPPEMVRQWCHEDGDEIKTSPRWYQIVCAKAACWGADQELEACCAWLIANDNPRWALALQEGRRPKPPSLAEQALETLRQMHIDPETGVSPTALDTIRRALERLQELEKGNE